MTTPLEIESKHRVADADADAEATAEAVRRSGATFVERVRQRDRYLAHPCRDFRETDEAFRLREEGGQLRYTYKGPRRRDGDSGAKIREELEVAIVAADPETHRLILDRLGFREVAVVDKRRENYSLSTNEFEVAISLDEVVGLGSFCELEIVAEPGRVDAARDALAGLADRLGLEGPAVAESYLELLLAKNAAADSDAADSDAAVREPGSS